MKSPSSEVIMPAYKPFLLAGFGLMPSAAIEGLANRGGEYQAAPRIHKITAETTMGQGLSIRWCIRNLHKTGFRSRSARARRRGGIHCGVRPKGVSRENCSGTVSLA